MLSCDRGIGDWLIMKGEESDDFFGRRWREFVFRVRLIVWIFVFIFKLGDFG